jgi:hypothetical protein
MKHTSQFIVDVLVAAIYKASLRHQATQVSGKVNLASLQIDTTFLIASK